MRDDRRPSHDPARGGIIGGGPLIARRPAHRSSGGHSLGGDNPVQSMSGQQNEEYENEKSLFEYHILPSKEL